MHDPYGDDEYYDDENYVDWDEEPEYIWFSQELVKAPNGHLVIAETYAYYYPSWQWQHEAYWETQYTRLKDTKPEYKPCFIEAGKRLKPGESMPLHEALPDDNDDDFEDLPGVVDELEF